MTQADSEAEFVKLAHEARAELGMDPGTVDRAHPDVSLSDLKARMAARRMEIRKDEADKRMAKRDPLEGLRMALGTHQTDEVR